MAKRGGSELHHENWDQEDEPEEAGTFKKAGDAEMKGRVIKKAKRRNLANGDDERKNVFAGFGGFAGAAKPASEAFSFLGKPAPTNSEPAPAAKPSFSFGVKPDQAPGSGFGAAQAADPTESSTSSAATTASFGQPVFGVASSGGPGGSGGFSFGGPAVAAPAAKATFSFGTSEEKKESAAPSFGSFAFGAKKTEENEKSGDEKVKTVEEVMPKPDEDLMKRFCKPKGWSCDVCMISNDADKEKCVACETPKPGSKPTESTEKPTFSIGKEGGFKFGGATSSSQTPAAGSGFTFGEKAVGTAPSAVGGFTFGVKSAVAGGTDNAAADEKKADNNGAGESGAPAGQAALSKEYLSHLKALNIQVTEWIKKHVDDNPLVILSPVFKDYEKHLAIITEKHNSTTTETNNKQPEPALGAAAFAPKNDSAEPEAKPKDSGSFSLSKGAGFSFNSAKPDAAAVKPGGFSFGAAATEAKKSDEPAPAKTGFSFGLAAAGTEKPGGGFSFPTADKSAAAPSSGGFSFSSSTAAAPATGGFSFGNFSSGGTTAAAAPAAKEEEEEEDKPPVVEVKQVQEEDALYSKKCKLFYKKDESYVEKGVGMLHLKPTETGKTQLLIRADTNLGNILLNILLNPQIPTTRVGKNNVMMVCVANPPLEPKKDDDPAKPNTMLIRVKTSDDADELKEKVDELKEK